MYPGISTETMGSAVRRVARTIIEVCMGVKPGESVLVISDNIRKDLGLPIYHAALETGNDAVYIEMKPRVNHGDEPPKAVANAMYDADVIVAMTKTSLTHTDAKIRAVKNGARIATMPFGSRSTDFVTEVFTGGGMSVDYKKMDENIRRLTDKLNGTRRARIITERGTDVVVNYEGREFRGDTGIVHDPGGFTNLPAGEVYVAPVNTEGVIVIDLTMGRLGRLKSPLELRVREGLVYSIRGERAEELENILAPFGPVAMNLAEFALGMNPNARICGLLLEDEKVANTAHFALGSNSGFGGDVSAGIHMDGVVDHPVVYIDGEKLNLNEYL